MTRKKLFQVVLHLVIGFVVLWGVYRAIEKSAEQLNDQRQRLSQQADELDLQAESSSPEEAESLHQQAIGLRRQVDNFWKADWRWLLLAGCIYGLSLGSPAAYWIMCMNAMQQRAPVSVGLWAYFYGNLAKYIPGKAMIVVVRIAILSPYGVRKVATTLAIFMETLTSMAVGGTLAAGCVLLLDIDWRIRLLAAGLLFVTMVPTTPALLRLVLRRLQPGIDTDVMDQWTSKINWRLTAKGWGLLSMTWLGFGLSLGCVLYGLPSNQWLSESTFQYWISIYAACALSIVIGFVSLLPAGAGVRELVLATVLSPVVGPVAALCCAVWLRIAWVGAEIVLAAICFLLKSWALKNRESSNPA